MTIISRIILSLSLYLAYAGQVNGASDSLRMLNYSTSNGLPSNNVYSSIRDKAGYQWFATENGVVKFNGSTFKIFNTSNGLPVNDIWRLYEDAYGRIWAFCNAHAFGYIKNDKYHPIKISFSSRILHPTSFIEYGKVIFVGFMDKGATYLGTIDSSDNIRYFQPITAAYDRLMDEHLNLYHFEKEFLTKFDLRGHRFIKTKQCKLPFSNYQLKIQANLNKTIDGITYSGRSRSNILYVINTNTCENRAVALDKLQNKADEHVYLLDVVEKRPLLFTNYGVYWIDSMKIRADETARTKQLQGLQISNRVSDVDKNIWYATNSAGAFCSMNQTRLPLSIPTNIPPDAMYAGKAGADTSYWWDKNSSTLIETKDFQPTQRWTIKPDGIIKTVFPMDAQRIWITTSSGIYTLKRIGGILNKYTDQFSNIKFEGLDTNPTDGINSPTNYRHLAALVAAHKLSNQNFYVSSFTGLSRYSETDGQLTVKHVDDDRFIYMAWDEMNGNYWLAGFDLVMAYNPVSEKTKILDKLTLESLGIKDIQDLKAHNGWIFILTNERLFIFDTRTFTLRSFFNEFNLDMSSLDVNGDHLILCGKFGIGYINLQDKVLNEKHWINRKLMNYNEVKSVTLSNSSAYIATDKYHYLFDLRELIETIRKDPPLPVHLVDATASSPIHNGDTIVLNRDLPTLTLDLINIPSHGKATYKYVLPEMESAWRTSTSGDILFRQLTPGKVYVVKCMVSDDLIKERAFNFYIVQPPYWYQTTNWKTIFWITGLLLFAGSLYLVAIVTRRRVAASNEQRRKQTELELRAIHSQINPHFIFNTLSTALYFMKTDKTKEAYEHVDKFSKLLRAYLRSSRERWTTLEEDILILEQYIQLQQIRLQHGLKYNIEIAPEINPRQTMIPSLLLQPLVENAIHHGLFNSGAEGKLSIIFKQDGEHDFVCIIEDNGIGRENAKALKQKQQDPRPSYGTEMTEDLIQTFKKYEQMDIKLKYIDKQEPETGTVVIVSFKKIKKVQ